MSSDTRTQQSPWALFLIGFITFSMLYAVQPLLPSLARQHNLSAADSALVLSVSTGTLAGAIWFFAARAAGWDRVRLMLSAMLLASVLNAASALSVTWPQLLLCRALMGLCLGAVPAMAMAHVAESAPAGRVAGAMGLYVAGTALGGMTGRVGLGILADQHGWQAGLLCVSAVSLVGIAMVARWMPPATRSLSRTQAVWVPAAIWWSLLSDPRLLRLFLCGGLASGLFVSAYNYAGFRLHAAPFGLSQSQIALIFCCYAFGVLSSGLAGRLASRFGAPRVLWASVGVTAFGVLISQFDRLSAFVFGLCLMTVGFFAMHAVCSGWVGAVAPRAAKAQATALYLLAYYAGASCLGYLGGWAWDRGGWPALSLGFMASLALFTALQRGIEAAIAPGDLPRIATSGNGASTQGAFVKEDR